MFPNLLANRASDMKRHTSHAIMVAALLVMTAPVVFATGANAQVICPQGFVCTPKTSNTSNVFYNSYGGATAPTGANGYYYTNGTYTTSGATYTQTVPTTQAGTNMTTYTTAAAGSCVGITSDLTVGSTGTQVVVLQKILLSRGLLKVSAGWTPTGHFGTLTQAAVRSYQAMKGLSQTGVVDASTRAVLSSSCTPMNTAQPVTQAPAQQVTPVVYSITPSSVSGYNIITMSGANLTGASTVTFTNSAGQFAGTASTNNVTANTLYFMTPSLAVGTYGVSVGNSNKVLLTVTQQPTITGSNSGVTTSPLTATCSNIGGNTTITWAAAVSGGTAPYTYSWSAYNDVSQYLGGNLQSMSWSASYSSSGMKQAVVTIRDSAGRSATGTCSATVSASSQATSGTTTVNPGIPSPNPAPAYNTAPQSCGGTEPYGLTYKKGSGTYTVGSGAPATWTFTTSSSPNSCQYACASGATYAGNGVCYAAGVLPGTGPTTQACGGSVPSAATAGYGYYTTGYGISNWTYVSGTPNACQFTCISGTSWNGSACAPTGLFPIPPGPGISSNTGTNGIGWNYPSFTRVGSQFTVTVTNMGTKTWGSNHDIGLSRGDTVVTLVSIAGVAPGSSKTVTMTAPTVAGSYTLQAVEQGVEWFGPVSPISINAQ